MPLSVISYQLSLSAVSYSALLRSKRSTSFIFLDQIRRDGRGVKILGNDLCDHRQAQAAGLFDARNLVALGIDRVAAVFLDTIRQSDAVLCISSMICRQPTPVL